MTEPKRHLARFRADPTKVRISLRPAGLSWHIVVESKCCPRCKSPFDAEGSCTKSSEGCQGGRGEHWVMTTNARLEDDIACRIIEIIVMGSESEVPGFDPYMDFAYDHPQSVETDDILFDMMRTENDNELMKRIGRDDMMNRV